MRKLVGMLEPFQQVQYLYVYEDGNKIEIKESSVDEFIDNAVNLIKTYNITDIDIKGPKKYAKNFGDKIKNNLEILSYSNSNINITYL